MFHVVASLHIINDEWQYSIRLFAERDGHERICGVLTLWMEEWLQFLHICEMFHIGVSVESREELQTTIAEAAPAD